MQSFSAVRGAPVSLSPSVLSQVYVLFALAMGLTVAGVFVGMLFAPVLLSSGIAFLLLLLEFGILLSASWWMRSSPLNILLFALFPLLSGITVTPYILLVLTGYANGASILLNALISTTLMALAAAAVARGTTWDIGASLGRVLFLSLIGLIVLGLLQVFIPSFRSGTVELLLSGAGIVVFAAFTAMDVQRVAALGRSGANPFLLALQLYLDIFNLFLYVLRFMLALSGNRRQ